MEDTEPEPVISCNQASFPGEGLGRQPSHGAFNLHFVLPIRCAAIKLGQKS